MANSIFGVPYANITNVLTSGATMGNGCDPNSFTDDGNTPPLAYSYTIGGGQIVVSGAYSSITGVMSNPPTTP